MRGACFSMIFLCVHVWCAFLLFSGSPQKKTDDSAEEGGGQIYKYLPSTCYIFLPPPPRYRHLIKIMVYLFKGKL